MRRPEPEQAVDDADAVVTPAGMIPAAPGLDAGAEPSLTRATAGGLAWSWLAIALTALLQLAYTAVMSRLLEPADFGQVAAALIGLRFVSYFARFGLGSAVVQRANLDRADVATAQTMTLVIGVASACGAVALSPALAAIVREADAAAVMRWMSLGMLIGVLTIVPEALLRRSMRFKALAVCQVVSFAIGYLGVGVPLAVRGWGVASLVAASLAQATVLLVLTVVLARPPLRLHVDRVAARRLASFGGTVSASGFLEFLSASADTIAVSRWIGATGLGQYTRATYLVGLPVEHATAAATRVLLPSFSRVQHDDARFVRGYLTSGGLLAGLVAVPVGMLAVGAPAVVPLVLGPGWDTAASLMPLLGAAYGLALLTSLPAIAAESRGVVVRRLVVQAIALGVTVGLILTARAFGPSLHGLALAWLVGELLRHLLYWAAVLPALGVPRPGLARRYAIMSVVSLAAATPLFLLVRVLHETGVAVLLVGGSLGLALGAAVVGLPMSRVVLDDVATVRASLRRHAMDAAPVQD